MKNPIRIDLDGPYYPKPSRYQRVWNGFVLAVLLTGVVLWLTGCGTTTNSGIHR